MNDILHQSEVGRSTFYEHFRDKDDLLLQSMTSMLALLASSLDETCDLVALEQLLLHFQENSQLARGLFNGPTYPQVIRKAASMIEPHLGVELNSTLPRSLIAVQAAHAQLGLIGVWLNTGSVTLAKDVAIAMHQSGVGLKRAYAGS